jgi:hypothetical protein
VLSLFVKESQDSNPFECRCPVDICLPTARRRQHYD